MDYMAQPLNEYFNAARNAILKAGNYIEHEKHKNYKIIRKEIRELVTEVDIHSQQIIIESLSQNTDCENFQSEETRVTKQYENSYWIIDPLDGTHNYIAGLPFYGVSIAFAVNKEIVMGLMYFPSTDELYTAIKGQGAFKNDKPIQVSKNCSLEKSIIAYDNQFHKAKFCMENFMCIQSKVFTTRILGVATRDASFIADGILDARVWNNTKLCDIAAGAIIVKEAGGKATDFQGKNLNAYNIKDVVISSGKFHNEILELLKK